VLGDKSVFVARIIQKGNQSVAVRSTNGTPCGDARSRRSHITPGGYDEPFTPGWCLAHRIAWVRHAAVNYYYHSDSDPGRAAGSFTNASLNGSMLFR